MNQDAFRQLLTTPRPNASSSLTPSRTVGQSTKKVILDPSQPVFQPRKVKKKTSESGYRDRASDRRAGVNDYAKVESVLEDFEQRTAEIEDRAAVEEQRRFLGGDQDHTILVKGLDFALLAQNKARAAESHEDDDSLEVAFQEAQSKPTVPKKRTREDIIRELKGKRAAAEATELGSPQPAADDTLEKAKKVGKFKPIGVQEDPKAKEKSKGNKGKEKAVGEGRKKKKRKLVHDAADTNGKHPASHLQPPDLMPPPPSPSKATASESAEVLICQPDPSDAPEHTGAEVSSVIEDDAQFDIFADVGEYEGVDLGDDEEEEQEMAVPSSTKETAAVAGLSESDGAKPAQSWFNDGEETVLQPVPAARPPTPPSAPEPEEEPESQSEAPTRLVPLASSALPSISDFLAMDAQTEAQKKKKARKEKKKGDKKEKVSTDVKVDRDYQRLNSYMAKKGGGSGSV